ncbi:MAG: hypothetical protein K8R68_02930 [Bacteroidales bacterium]|nr:hypothetical protein [Bacteroidales bacterium]
MKKITISNKVRDLANNIKLGAVYANVKYEKLNKDLWREIDAEIQRVSKIPIDQVKNIPQIASSRNAYRAMGKEPARYRLSAEALHRRIINGKGIYQICNIVDVINLSSVKTGYSIGGYDYSKIKGDIIFDIGKTDEDYDAIGRGKMNIESLPVFRDATGAFGSPTSDSVRTMISDKTKEILLAVINFGGYTDFDTDLLLICNLLERFCSAENIEIQIFLRQ